MKVLNVNSAPQQPSIWMYLSGIVMVYCGLLAARSVIEDHRFVNTITVLVLVGFVFSFVARQRGWFQHTAGVWIRWVLAGLIVYALFSFWTQGGVTPFDVETAYGGTAVTFLLWLIVFSSFMLASDEHVLFVAVPVLALLGVTAPAFSTQQSVWLFTTFLGNVAFLMAHENFRRLYGTGSSSPLLMRTQIIIALTCGLAAALTGVVLGLPMKNTTVRLTGGPLPSGVASAVSSSTAATSFTRPMISVGTGPVSLSDQPVLEVHSSEPLYWRGSVYIRYTGRGWSNPRFGFFSRDLFDAGAPFASIPERQGGLYRLDVPPVSSQPARYREVTQRFKLLHGASNIIYGAAQPVQVRFPNLAVRVDPTGCLQSAYGYRWGTEYEVISHVPDVAPDDLRKARPATPFQIDTVYFEVPPNPRLRELAQQLTARYDNNYDKVRAIQAYLESTCVYNLDAPAVPVGRDAVEFFLFESREGYCDLFSTALAVLARYAGIPSRVATGFLSGDPQPDGRFIAREKHRHQWTEIYFPGFGWITFDATEGVRDVTDARRKKGGFQNPWGLLTRRYGYLPWVLVLAAISLLLFALFNEVSGRIAISRAPASRVVRCYLQATRALQKAGVARQEWMTPSEYAALVQQNLPEVAVAVWSLTRLLERSEYGRGINEAEMAQAEKHLREIRAVLARRYRLRLR